MVDMSHEDECVCGHIRLDHDAEGCDLCADCDGFELDG